jgi:hypothetical protein
VIAIAIAVAIAVTAATSVTASGAAAAHWRQACGRYQDSETHALHEPEERISTTTINGYGLTDGCMNGWTEALVGERMNRW